jgi:hypothetical protein
MLSNAILNALMMMICSTLLGGCDLISQIGQASVSSVQITESNGKVTALSQDEKHPTPLKLSLSGLRLSVPALLDDEVAIQLCASSKALPTLVGDVEIDSLDCLASGTGLAMANTPPARGLPMYVSEGDGHNYYSVERRVSKDGQTIVNINRVIDASAGQQTHILVLINANQDSIASPQERWYATATWE